MDSNSQSLKSGDLSTALSCECESNSEKKQQPIGPDPVVIPSISEVREQRLRKKILKLTQQRDHWKSEFDKLSYILRLFPYSYGRAIEKFDERAKQQADKQRLTELGITQALLVSENERLKKQIETLQKDS